MCDEIVRTLQSNDSCVGGDNGLKGLVGNNHSNLLVYQALVRTFIINSLVWVERGRARTLLTQLGPWYDMRHGGGNPGSSLKKELIEFDEDEQVDCCCYSFVPCMHNFRRQIHCKQPSQKLLQT